MKTWQKVAIGAGAFAALTGLGYCVYKITKKPAKAEEKAEKSEKEKREAKEEDKEVWESISSEESEEEEHKAELTDLMDEVLIDSMEFMQKYAEVASQLNKESEEERQKVIPHLRANIQEMVSALERDVCTRRGWDVKEYTQEVQSREDAGDT